MLNVLVTLRAGVETESSRSELEAALGKTGTIAGAARAITSVEVSEESAAASLTLLSKGARGTGSPVLATSVPGGGRPAITAIETPRTGRTLVSFANETLGSGGGQTSWAM
jgi:hypothetical protein